MITEQESPPSVGMAPLISGIIQDAQTLLRQQLTLFQTEVKQDLRRTRDAVIPLGRLGTLNEMLPLDPFARWIWIGNWAESPAPIERPGRVVPSVKSGDAAEERVIARSSSATGLAMSAMPYAPRSK